MRYLNEEHIQQVGLEWSDIIDVMCTAVHILKDNLCVQPIKPYLRYNDLSNRIIAMPAFVGGEVNTAGLKWIASFPKNILNDTARAHSITILNNAETGIPTCIINTTLVSGIRTAGVTGLIIKQYLKWKKRSSLRVAIIGYGPIGQLHHKMLLGAFQDYIDLIMIYDIDATRVKPLVSSSDKKIKICNSWQEAFITADLVITCTVSNEPYIDLPPKKGSLQLNVSLRDYKPSCRKYMDVIIVDNWDEICRENTDIEKMHQQFGLQKADTYDIVAATVGRDLYEKVSDDTTVMFNPMGMAIFDIALGKYYLNLAAKNEIGFLLST